MTTSHRTQSTIAALLASSVILGGSWIVAAQAAPTPDTPCTDAVAIAATMHDLHNELAGTTAARAIAIDLGMDEKVAELTPQMQELDATLHQHQQRFDTAAAACD